ncbi:unnamed protein product, partial [Staurois parvus]
VTSTISCRSRVGIEIAQNFGPVRVTNCAERPLIQKPKCQPGMKSTFPSGYYFSNTWNPAYCTMTTYKTTEDFVKCLQGKKLFLIGDSTLRQFIMHFTEGISSKCFQMCLKVGAPKSREIFQRQIRILPMKFVHFPCPTIP